MRLITILFLISYFNLSAARVPSWAKAYVEKDIPNYVTDGDAVILHKSHYYEISQKNKITRKNRCVLKLLNRSGEDHAVLSDYYSVKDDEVLKVRAWMLQKNGTLIKYDKSDISFYSISDRDTLYTDTNKLYFSPADDAKKGSYFIYEYEIMEKTDFAQLLFDIPDNFTRERALPIDELIYSVKLPEGWRLEYKYKNDPELIYDVDLVENIHTWKGQFRVEEVNDQLIDYASLSQSINIDFFPQYITKEKELTYQNFTSWKDVSQYTCDLEEDCLVADESVQSKVESLIRGKSTLEEKIQALAYYAQSLNYTSISENISYGGGYKPHKASEVLKRNYGDCKDKTALLMSMLRCIGVESYSANCYSGKNSVVDPLWPSPYQMNHRICLISVPDDFASRACIECHELGKLLIFDPTCASTSFGDIPDSDRGSYLNVTSVKIDRLLKIPELEDDFDIDHRIFKASIDEQGSLSFTLEIEARGQEAVYFKRLLKNRSKKDFKESIEKVLTKKGCYYDLNEIEVEDLHEEGVFRIKADFVSLAYAKNFRNYLLTFNPVILPWKSYILADLEERQTGILLTRQNYDESIEIDLPEGFEIDEMGEDLAIVEDFGRYTISYTVEGKTLSLKRSLKVSFTRLGKGEYKRVKQFFDSVYESEHTPVVLEKI